MSQSLPVASVLDATHSIDSSDSWFRALAQEAQDVFIRAELFPTFHHVYVSPSVVLMTGYTSEEVMADPSLLMRLMHPDDRDAFQTMVATRAALPPAIIFRMYHKDGHLIWTENRCTGIYDAAGRLIAIEGVVRDITRAKDTEEALRRSREMLRGVLDYFPGAVCWKDRNSVYLGCNEACARSAGVASPAQIVGKTDFDLPWAKTEAEAYRADDRFVMESGAPKLGIIETQLRSDGQVIWLETSKIPMFDSGGKVVGILVASSDITERRRAEEAGRQARESAEIANKAKDQFLARLSHELRTPLTPVLTAVQLVEQEPGISEQLRQTMRLIRRNVELETRLIDDLLDLTRIEQGKLELHCALIDLNEQIQHAIDMCRGEIVEKAMHISFEPAAACHHVTADAARLQQIFWNLVKNSIKFTPACGRITVRTANPREGLVSIAVQDTGVGIESSALSRIFLAFEQGGRDITRRFGGMGLGLAISKSLAELHGGTLSAYSEGEGKGSVFTLELPSVHAPATDAHQMHAGQAAARTSLKGVRVLLVEDHVDTAGMLSALLGRYGCEVRIEYGVASAIRAATDEPFDVVISDIGLPDGSGTDLIKQLLDLRPIKGIALSGYGMDQDIQRSLDAGFCAHLTKPVGLARLQEVLQQVVSS